MVWDRNWESVFSGQPWGKYPGEDLIRFVARHFYGRQDRSSTRLLEVGCGTGANLWFLAREGFAVFGIDGSQTAAEIARRRLDSECPGWNAAPRYGRIDVGDIVYLDAPNDTFDATLDSEAVYCNSYEDSRRIYREMYRVAMPGGRLFMRTFATGSWGHGTGACVGPNAYIADAGPLRGKGYSRFADRDELAGLVEPWKLTEVNLITRTMEAERQQIREWIVEAEKSP